MASKYTCKFLEYKMKATPKVKQSKEKQCESQCFKLTNKTQQLLKHVTAKVWDC